jgi:hypothetical protein
MKGKWKNIMDKYGFLLLFAILSGNLQFPKEGIRGTLEITDEEKALIDEMANRLWDFLTKESEVNNNETDII